MVESPPCQFILIRLPLGKGGSLGLIDSMCLRNEVPIKTMFTRAHTASLVAALITVSHACASRTQGWSLIWGQRTTEAVAGWHLLGPSCDCVIYVLCCNKSVILRLALS